MKVKAIPIPMGLALLLALGVLSACTDGPSDPPPYSSAPAASSVQEPGSPDVIILTHTGFSDSITHLAALHFKEELEAASENDFYVDVYPTGTLGGREDTGYALRQGTITMHFGASALDAMMIAQWVPLTGSMEVFRERAAGEAFQELLKWESDEKGLVFLGMLSSEYRYLSSNRSIESAADFAGLRLGGQRSESVQGFWNPLGVQLIPCPRDQVYMALQQGMIDAQEDILEENLRTQFYRHQPYLLRSEHQLYCRTMVINKTYYEELPEHKRRMLNQAVEATALFLHRYMEDYRRQCLAELAAKGVILQELSPQLREEIYRLAYDPLVQGLQDQFGEQKVAEVLAALEPPSD